MGTAAAKISIFGSVGHRSLSDSRRALRRGRRRPVVGWRRRTSLAGTPIYFLLASVLPPWRASSMRVRRPVLWNSAARNFFELLNPASAKNSGRLHIPAGGASNVLRARGAAAAYKFCRGGADSDDEQLALRSLARRQEDDDAMIPFAAFVITADIATTSTNRLGIAGAAGRVFTRAPRSERFSSGQSRFSRLLQITSDSLLEISPAGRRATGVSARTVAANSAVEIRGSAAGQFVE